MRKAYIILLIILATFGCQSDDQQNTLSPQIILDKDSVKNLENKVKADLASVDGPNQETVTTSHRNQILDDQIRLIDAYYLRYERSIVNGKANTDLAFDIATLFFSGAATVMGGEETKTALAGAAAFTSGTKLAINQNLYFQQTSPALTAKMRAGRLVELGVIKGKQAKPIIEYSFVEAEHDILDYYIAGTIYGAVEDIIQQSQTQSKDALKVLATVSAAAATRPVKE